MKPKPPKLTKRDRDNIAEIEALRLAFWSVMNKHNGTQWLDVSIGFSISCVHQEMDTVTLTASSWSPYRNEKTEQSIAYPKYAWKIGINGMIKGVIQSLRAKERLYDKLHREHGKD